MDVAAEKPPRNTRKASQFWPDCAGSVSTYRSGLASAGRSCWPITAIGSTNPKSQRHENALRIRPEMVGS